MNGSSKRDTIRKTVLMSFSISLMIQKGRWARSRYISCRPSESWQENDCERIINSETLPSLFQNAILSARKSLRQWRLCPRMFLPLDRWFRCRSHRPSDEIRRRLSPARRGRNSSQLNRLKMLKVSSLSGLSFVIYSKDSLHILTCLENFQSSLPKYAKWKEIQTLISLLKLIKFVCFLSPLKVMHKNFMNHATHPSLLIVTNKSYRATVASTASFFMFCHR